MAYNENYLRNKVLEYLTAKSQALMGGAVIGADIQYNRGILKGGKRASHMRKAPAKRHGPYKAVARAHPRTRRGVTARRAIGGTRSAGTMSGGRRRRVGGARHGNVQALSHWHAYLHKYRMAHPHMSYRQAQHNASMAYHK